MGTSASGGGAGGGNSLIPTWIGGGGAAGANPDNNTGGQDQQGQGENPGNNPGNHGQPSNGADGENGGGAGNAGGSRPPYGDQQVGSPNQGGNRYRQPRIEFNRYVRSGGTNRQALKSALRSYSRNAAGNTSQLARRMAPSASRVGGFYDVINTVKERGKIAALTQFNLASYQDKPVFEILAALTDIIFQDTGKIYEDTQDDAIAKYAWCNTIDRISELADIDLDNLTNDQVEVMMATFIEETIAQRVINDIGDKFTKTNADIQQLRDIEDNIYQIISGMVRNEIMPEITATQRGDRADLETKIENIYRLAFDTMAGIND